MNNHTVNDLKNPEIESYSKEIVETVFGGFKSSSPFQIELNKYAKNPGINQDPWTVDINNFRN